MKKRREAFIASALMCLLALTACGQTGAAGETPPEEISSVETSSPETFPVEIPLEETPDVYTETNSETESQEIVTVVEEVSGVTIAQTGSSAPSDGYGLWEPVRLQITWDRDGQHGEQEIVLNRINSPLTTDRKNCQAWDGDDDGYEDILYYTGDTSGSGGVWDIYYLLRWSEEKQEYESIEMPGCDYISYEDHKFHSLAQDGVAFRYYSIYGLRDGEYQLEKELTLWDRMSEDQTWVLTVEYSEYGETVETIDLSPAPNWEQAKSVLKEKYPEFIYWWGD